MSAIDSLIESLCPHGVRYLNLFEVSSYVRGITYSKDDEDEQGEFIVLRANNIDVHSNCIDLSGLKRIRSSVRVRAEQSIVSGDILMCAASGSKVHVGKVAFFKETPDNNLLFGGFMAVIRANGKVNSRFLYHLLIGKTFSDYLERSLNTTTINNISASLLEGFKVPVPPLEVQHEIVRILDTFKELEVELEAELEARKKQYEHYRYKLLSTDLPAGVTFKTLGDLLGPIRRGKRLTKVNLAEAGSIPVFHGGLNPIGYHDESNTAGETVMVINTGASSGTVGWSHTPFWCSDGCFALPHSNVISPRFLYHFASLNEKYFTEKVRKAGIPTLAAESILSLPMPVLPLSKQLEIARTLDAFFELASNLSRGLPAEIEPRRKQYEYYRDRLLTFKERAA
jgi:type I restriction enzyme S subunit